LLYWLGRPHPFGRNNAHIPGVAVVTDAELFHGVAMGTQPLFEQFDFSLCLWCGISIVAKDDEHFLETVDTSMRCKPFQEAKRTSWSAGVEGP